jgi:hypothetical protein
MKPSARNPIGVNGGAKTAIRGGVETAIGGAEVVIGGGGETRIAPGGRRRRIDCAPGGCTPGGTSLCVVSGYGYLILLKEKDDGL